MFNKSKQKDWAAKSILFIHAVSNANVSNFDVQLEANASSPLRSKLATQGKLYLKLYVFLLSFVGLIQLNGC